MSPPRSDSRRRHALRVFHTARHLSARQALYFFIRRGLGPRRIKPEREPPQLRDVTLPAIFRIGHGNLPGVLLEFTFLNHTLRFRRENIDWNPAEASRLWRYHLHYFDFLRDDRFTLSDKFALVDDWIRQNPQGREPAWEPYTASLRIVNWCVFFWSVPRATVKDEWLRSLYEQARWLESNLEWHILGNHYFENIKALLFAACFFESLGSAIWLEKFQRELIGQLSEQVLGDGGHYERSPHYHCIFLQGCIELYALHRANSYIFFAETAARLKRAIAQGLIFLCALRTPDDNIPLFNDSVLAADGAIESLRRAAGELGIVDESAATRLIECRDSGYFGYKTDRDYFLIDCGDIGPAYQPGHTHCDFLSFVLMRGRQWLVVDSGVFEYAAGAMRQYVRSTSAHNTVGVDQAEQSDIWGEFRVGRRAARVFAHIAATPSAIEFEGEYTGFARIDGGVRHRRQARLQLDGDGNIAALSIEDGISGNGAHRLTSHIHLHPSVSADIDGNVILLRQGQRQVGRIQFDSGLVAALDSGWYCPEFGKKLVNRVIRLSCTAALPHRFGYRLALSR